MIHMFKILISISSQLLRSVCPHLMPILPGISW